MIHKAIIIGERVTCRESAHTRHDSYSGIVVSETPTSLGVQLDGGGFKEFPRTSCSRAFSRAKEQR